MLNYKLVLKILGLLLLMLGVAIMLCVPVAMYYKESEGPIFATAGITFVSALLLLIPKANTKEIGIREGYLIVTLGWILFSLVGSLPFIFSGSIPSFTDAFFETISGFTTTGASILNNIEELPYYILFWRSLTQWLGGMGIIVLTLAILPMLGIGGMQLFAAEVPGPTPDKIHPRIKETAKRLWGIYVGFTVMETILLMIGGMSFFEAINHSFTTMATGGYSTKQASVAFYSSPYIQYIIIVFMFLAGMNFTLSYSALKGRFDKVFGNEEFKFYSFTVIVFSFTIAIGLFLNNSGISFEESFRNASFQVVSILTTTGFATDDYLLWSPFLIMLIFLLMFFGGSAGSTGGGIKIVRIMTFIKNAYLEFKRQIHPNAIIPLRIDKEAVQPDIVTNIVAFVSSYFIIYIIAVVFMAALGNDFLTSLGSVAATLGNIGPGLGKVGPAGNFADICVTGKWFLSFLMLVGRLELFTVLLLFVPDFWRK